MLLENFPLLFLAAVSGVTAQGDLLGLLYTQPNLSTLRDAIELTGLNSTLSEASNITIVAPTNGAFEKLLALNIPESWALGNGTNVSITALLQNHVFRGFYPADAIQEVPTFAQTLLTSELSIQRQLFTGITGGQYNGLVRNGDKVQVLSGELSVATVVQADVPLGDGIIIHVIDETLFFGPPFQVVTARAGYTDFNAVSALSQYNDTLSEFSADQEVAELTDLTVFVPDNAAFENIANIVAAADVATVDAVIGYYILDTNIVFSPSIGNTTVTTVQGGQLTLTVLDDGTIFVNNAKVIFPNIISTTGVAHIIDGVLNPLVPFDRSQLQPSAPAAERVAYDGATSSALSFTDFPYATETTNTYTISAVLTKYPVNAEAEATSVPANASAMPTMSAVPSQSVVPATGDAADGKPRSMVPVVVATIAVAVVFAAYL